jgi:hypothetical protein
MILGIICCALPDWTDPLDWALAVLGSLYSTKLLSSSSPSSEANDSSACVDQLCEVVASPKGAIDD